MTLNIGSQNVYAIVSGDAVKIGVTRNRVQSRLDEMQTGNPVELKIWTVYETRVMPPYEIEKLIHTRLAEYRIRGEWFYPVRAVMEVLEAMQGGYIENLLKPNIAMPLTVNEIAILRAVEKNENSG